jgi:hypothetical protein
MGISTRIDIAADVRVRTVNGKLTFAELRDALESVYAQPDYRPDQSVLWDLRNAVLTAFSAEEVRAVADLVRMRWGTQGAPKAALVVCRDADFGMARMFEMQLGLWGTGEIRVFRDMDEAMAWLDAGRRSGGVG